MRPARLAALYVLVFAFSAGGYPPVPKAKDKKADKDLLTAMAGTWEVTSLERGGAKAKAPPSQYLLVLTRDGQKLTRTLQFKDGRPDQPATILLTPTKSPAWFDVHTQDKPRPRLVMKGIVKVDGDKMTWVSVTAGGERPTKIDGDLSTGQYRYTYKRVKKP